MKSRACFFILSMVSICMHISVFSFQTLSDAHVYAQKNEEFPLADNADWSSPDYTSFYKKQMPGIVKRSINSIASLLHISRNIWSQNDFKQLLLQVLEEREKKGLRQDHLVKFTPKIGTKYILWGSLFGAFHSLLRDLEKLKDLQILDDNFKIIQPDHYFVFNGNVIGWSPFNLETLTIVLRLLQENPDKVFYIRGDQEYADGWLESSLRSELEIRCKRLSDEVIPLQREVTRFFETLPLALYARGIIEDKEEFLRIAHFGETFEKLDEQNFANFLHEHDGGKPTIFYLANRMYSKVPVDLSVVFSGEYDFSHREYTGDLELLKPYKGATQWRFLSSPTAKCRNIFQFHNDAFAELTVMPWIGRWDLKFYKRDRRGNDPFETRTYVMGIRKIPQEGIRIVRDQAYYVKLATELEELIKKHSQEVALMEEKQKTIGTTFLHSYRKKKITIGSFADLSKIVQNISKAFLEGVQLSINRQNTSGGVDGRSISFVVLDDQYAPSKTLAVIERLRKEYNTDIFVCPIGTPTTLITVPLIERKEIAIFFPYTGTTLLRRSDLKNIVNFRPSYASEAFVAIDYLINVEQRKKIAIFYQDDEYGYAGLIGARTALKQFNVKSWCEASYRKGSVDIIDAASEIIRFNPDAIVFVSVQPPSENLVRHLGVGYLSGRLLIGITPLEEFRSFLESRGLKIVLMSVVPNFKDESLEIVSEYNEQVRLTQAMVSKNSLEGYIGASLFIDALKEVAGDSTKEKLIAVMEGWKFHRFKGLDISFDPVRRELSKSIWIDNGTYYWPHRIISEEFLAMIDKEAQSFSVLQKKDRVSLSGEGGSR